MLNQLAAIIVDGVLLGLIYAIVGLGLSLVLGIMGIVNVAHSAFVMLGSFFAFELFRRLGIDPIISFVAAFPVFFILGAIVDRSPLLVAISSGGAAPMLATAVRARLEALLDESWSRLAGFADRWRQAIRRARPAIAARRRLYEWLLEGPVAEAVLRGARGC